MKLLSLIKDFGKKDIKETQEDERRNFWWSEIVSEDSQHARKVLKEEIRARVTSFEGHAGSVQTLCLLEDKQLLFSGGFDSLIMVWSLKDGHNQNTLSGHEGGVTTLAYDKGKGVVASGSSDGSIKIWDLQEFECKKTLRMKSEELRAINCILFTHGGSKIISTGEENIMVWNVETSAVELKLANEKNQLIYSACILKNQGYLFTGHECHVIRIWNIMGQGSLVETMYGHSNCVTSVIVNDANTHLISASLDRSVRIWRLSDRQCIKTLNDSAGSIHSVAICPNDRYLFAASGDQTVRKYDLTDFSIAAEVCRGHTNEVFSVVAGLTMAYSGGLDKAIKGWNSTSTAPVTNFEGHSEGVTVIRLDHREEKVFSGSEDYSIKIWDLEKRMCERVLLGHKDHVTDLAVTKNSEVLFSCSLDGTIKIWKLSEEFRCFNTIYEHKGPVHALAMSPKSKILYSASEDKSIKVWDMSTLKCLGTLDEHDKGVNTICVGNQEAYLYSGSEDCTIKIWSTKTLQCIDTLVGHLAGVSRIITRLGEDINLFSAGKDKIIKGWSAEERICKITFKGHKDQVYDLGLSKNKNLLLSCSLDKTIKVWAIKSGECINTFYGHSDSVTCLYAFRKSNSILSGSKDRSIKLWGLDIPGTNTLVGKGHAKEVTCIRPLVKGEFLMSMGADNTIRFWSTSTMQQVKVLSTESTGFAGALVMDESMLVVGSADNSLKVMDLADESTKMRVEPNGEAISCLAVSANGDFIFSGSKRGNSTIRVTHLVSGNEVRDLVGHRSPVNCLCLVDSLGLLISGSQDRDIRVWDVHQMECKNTLKGHGESVSCLLLDPRGIFFYSGSSDRTVKVWSMKQLNLVVTFQGHEGDVVALAANSRGNLLFSASCDHTIKIWSTIDFSLIETFDTKEDIVRSLYLVLEDRLLCGGGDTGMIYSWDLSTIPNFRGLDMYSLECLYGFMIAETYQEKENNLKNFINCLSQSNDAHYIHRVNPNLFTASLEYTRVLEFSLNAFGYCSVTSVEDDDLLFRILKDDSKRNNHLETLCDYLCSNISQIRFYNKIINQLIVSSNLKVQKLLMALFEKDVEPQQGSFLRRKGKLKQTPICLEIQNAKIISESEQQAILKKSKDLNSIDWLITKFPIDLRNGCICSRDFFRGLDDCSYEVIMSDFQHLINYKWKLLRPYILVHGMGFWTLIICMSYHIVFAQTSVLLLIACIILNIVYICYEMICAWGEFAAHLCRDMNWLDLACLGVNILALLVLWTKFEAQYRYAIFVFDILFYFFRGITFLRIFKQTRYLISMILRVFIDIVSFLAILFLFVTAISIITMNVALFQNPDNPVNFGDAFTTTYLIALGQFQTDGFTTFQWLQFIVTTIVLTLVMLNLLIAIINNAYDEVKEEREYFDLKEKLQIISDFENFMSKLLRRESFDIHYQYHLISYYESKSSGEQLIQNLTQKVAVLEDKLVGRLQAFQEKADMTYQLLRVNRKNAE